MARTAPARGRPQPPEPQATRLAQLRAWMRQQRLDAFLVQDRLDQFWLTGFTGEDGTALITAREVVLLTDGRFDETADREAPYARKVIRKRRTPDVTALELRRRKLTRVGFAENQMSVAEFRALGTLAKPVRLVPGSSPLSMLRAVKTSAEVDQIRVAIDIAQRAFQRMQAWLRPGRTERQIAARLAYEMQSLGAEGESFPAIVAAGATSSLPHYQPQDRPFEPNQPLLIDWGARVGWYVSDLTRVLWVGSLPPRLRKIFDVVRTAHDQAIAAVRPGIPARQVDRVARSVMRAAGYEKKFNHGLGHGIGLAVHEAPRVSRVSTDELQPGMVITIEPGIYVPGLGGVRLEDDVLVTASGCEVLSSLPLDGS
ncbi:MAG: aminopeptidase P family protein [Phycisphaerales bacterium]|nr:aminopeptidase P family protein [Phycisphaerales bacterium]